MLAINQSDAKAAAGKGVGAEAEKTGDQRDGEADGEDQLHQGRHEGSENQEGDEHDHTDEE
ncbi:hypothetical protein HK405_004161, partial [Cladochytrium tenue]